MIRQLLWSQNQIGPRGETENHFFRRSHVACGDKGVVKSISFQIPSLPVSINALYDIDYKRRRVDLKPAARRWKSTSKDYVLRFPIAHDSLLQIDFVFHYRFYTAKQTLRIFDSANLTKLAIDCICEKLEVNDCRVKSGSWASVDSEREFVEVTLTEIPNG